MPQISKGGKYVFGWSKIREDGGVVIPGEAVQEYHLEPGEKVILISGSKTTGGFLVAKMSMIEGSEISDVLVKNPALAHFQMEEGKTIRYKGRLYSWANLRTHGLIVLPEHALSTFTIKPGDCLLSIRGSNLAFVLGVKGPIIEAARKHPEIMLFE